MIKILIITPHPRNCNSWWRSVGPFQAMEKATNRQVQIDVIEENFSWNILCRYDLIFMHRPFRPDHLQAMQVARLQNIPVWVDYDDWLFDLPKWNPNHKDYSNVGFQAIIAHILATADVVSCSTAALYDRFKVVNPNVVIVPNAYRPDIFPYREAELKPRENIFVWRGSNTHDGDLASVASAFPRLSAKTHFLGSPNWSIVESMPPEKVQLLTEQDTFPYFKYLYDMKPKVMLFPLKACFFNECKSNIAWIEAVHAGAMCVAPDLREWRHPGIINYQIDNAESFYDAAEMAMAMTEEQHTEQVSMSYEHMRQKYDMSVVNTVRWEIIQSMISPQFKRNTRDPFCQMTQMWAFCHMANRPMVQVSPETLQAKNLPAQS